MRFVSKIKKVAATLTCHIPEPGSQPKTKKPVKNNLTNQPFHLQAPETGTIAMRRRLAPINIDAASEKAPLLHITPACDDNTGEAANTLKPTRSLRRHSLSPAMSKKIKSMAITIDIKTLANFFDESELDAKRFSARSSALEM